MNGVMYFVTAIVSLIAGAIIGFLTARYIFQNQIKEWQKKMQEPDKEQVRNMLSALGKKPSEEQVNRFISMTKNSAKKGQNDSKNNLKKKPLKKKK